MNCRHCGRRVIVAPAYRRSHDAFIHEGSGYGHCDVGGRFLSTKAEPVPAREEARA